MAREAMKRSETGQAGSSRLGATGRPSQISGSGTQGKRTPALAVGECGNQSDAFKVWLLPVTRKSMPAPSVIFRLFWSEARTMTPVGSVRPA